TPETSISRKIETFTGLGGQRTIPFLMSDYRRAYVPGGTFFLTLVMYNRLSLLADSRNISQLRRALVTVRQEHPFEVIAAVVLPDHLHFLWTLPPSDPNFSKRVGRLKVLFTQSLQGRPIVPQ